MAACAAGAEAFRMSIRRLALSKRVAPLSGHRLAPSTHIRLAVSPIDKLPLLPLHIDFVSAGAITNAAVFTLTRVPGFESFTRVFDDDIVQLSNLNRYPLFTLNDLGAVKVKALQSASLFDSAVEAVPLRLDHSTIDFAMPLAPQVVVGVDDIPSRWLIQRHTANWLCVAGTSHFEAVISEHIAGGPCAGCMHPKDDPGDDPIPTVSFVSLLAGVLQAHRLVSHAAAQAPASPVVAWAFGLDGEHGIHQIGQSPRIDCPIQCEASKTLMS